MRWAGRLCVAMDLVQELRTTLRQLDHLIQNEVSQ
jgi:hypothetical protein